MGLGDWGADGLYGMASYGKFDAIRASRYRESLSELGGRDLGRLVRGRGDRISRDFAGKGWALESDKERKAVV